MLTNSFLLGVEQEHLAWTRGEPAPAVYDLLQQIYTIIFASELCFRMAVLQRLFIFSSTWAWNLFDFICVAPSLIEMLLLLVTAFGNSTTSTTNMRIVRMLRVTRILRTFRIPRIVRFVSALRTLLCSIFVTLKSLIWTFVLIVMLTYVFALVFAQNAHEHLSPSDEDSDLYLYWGSVLVAMYTLFQSVSGGVSWRHPVVALTKISYGLQIFFILFIFFTTFAVLNVVTGIFCNSAIETTRTDPDLAAASLFNVKKMYVERLKKLFENMDADMSGFITIGEFERLLENDNLMAYFETMGLEASDAWGLFKLLDRDDTNEIDIDEFVDGCMKLKGQARSVDVGVLLDDSKYIVDKLEKLAKHVDKEFKLLHEENALKLPALTRKISAGPSV